jgi:RNA polymerase subunit RPABC4/transcription elongation factor Spt4
LCAVQRKRPHDKPRAAHMLYQFLDTKHEQGWQRASRLMSVERVTERWKTLLIVLSDRDSVICDMALNSVLALTPKNSERSACAHELEIEVDARLRMSRFPCSFTT